jgi:hypothetical protein
VRLTASKTVFILVLLHLQLRHFAIALCRIFYAFGCYVVRLLYNSPGGPKSVGSFLKNFGVTDLPKEGVSEYYFHRACLLTLVKTIPTHACVGIVFTEVCLSLFFFICMNSFIAFIDSVLQFEQRLYVIF